MLRSAIFILLLTFSLFAQEKDKGIISLTLNEEKIVLPINTVTMKKEDTILLTARAEQNNENIQQIINIEVSLKDLSMNKRSIDVSKSFIFEIRSRTSEQEFGSVLLLNLDRNTDRAEIQYSEKGHQWKMASFHLKMDVTNISFLENKLQIKGEFNIESWSEESEEPLKPVVEIKDGKFEIII